MKKINSNTLLIGIVLIMIAAVLRVANNEMHWYNFAPYTAIGLFCGAIFMRTPLAFIFPLVAVFVSDLAMQIFTDIPGFYGTSQVVNYAAIILVALLGSLMKKQNALNVLGFSVGGTLIFWLVSNLGVFMTGMYGYTLSGFAQTYLMALPFYNHSANMFFFNPLLGDIIFNGLFFGIYGFATSQTKSFAIAK